MNILLLKEVFFNTFVPLAINFITTYIKSSSSNTDDKVLEVIKIGTEYLAEKNNNTVAKEISKELNKTTMIKTQKSRLG
jgi:hypothetical protein